MDNDLNKARVWHPALLKTKKRLFTVALILLCTPGTGVNLCGESPLYENLMIFIVMNVNKSTSRRQERLREEGSEGSWSVPKAFGMRDDEQKPHIRLSSWASRHNGVRPVKMVFKKAPHQNNSTNDSMTGLTLPRL